MNQPRFGKRTAGQAGPGTIIIKLFWLAGLIWAALPASAGCYCMMECMESATNWNKTGFTECLASTPPKYFLQQNTLDTGDFNRTITSAHSYSSIIFSEADSDVEYFDINNVIPGTSTLWGPHDTDTITDQGSKYYADDSGEQLFLWNYKNVDTDGTNVCTGSWETTDSTSGDSSGSPCGAWTSPATGYADTLSWTETSNLCTSTVEMYLYINSVGPYGPESDRQKELTTLSGEYTDDMLRSQIYKRLPAYPASWTGGTGLAFYTLNATHYAGGGGRMKYHIKVPNSILNAEYLAVWQEVTDYPTNSTATMQEEKIYGNGGTAYGKDHTVDMPANPSLIYETAPDVIAVTGGGSGSSAAAAAGSGGPPGK